MPFRLEEVKDERDFDLIYPMLHDSFSVPYNPILRMFVPIHTTKEAAIQDAKTRAIDAWKEHEGKHWVKVTDTASGAVVGAAEWGVTKQLQDIGGDPSQPIVADWHIEGSVEKEFAGQYLTGVRSFVSERITRPHLELEQIVVHPDHRRKGVGKLLTDWGHEMADKLNVECFVVSVPLAVPVYEKIGYGNGGWVLPELRAPPNFSDKWSEYAAEDLRAFLMWRPAGHDFQAGNDRVPWLANH